MRDERIQGSIVPRNSSVSIILKLAIITCVLFTVGFVIGGLNATYVAKSLAESGGTSLSDVSRRLDNALTYFQWGGVSLLLSVLGLLYLKFRG